MDNSRLKRIEKEFFFHISGIAIVEVILTSHLFIKRVIKGVEEQQIRSHMFKRRTQYEELLTHAIRRCNLLEFADKGRVSIVFNYSGDRYAILLDVDTMAYLNSQNNQDEKYSITVITVDKISIRHYSQSGIFAKEKNKIYSDYTLPFSHILKIEHSHQSTAACSVYSTYYFNTIAQSVKLDEQVNLIALNTLLINKAISNSFKFGSHWISFNTSVDRSFYILLSVESYKNEQFTQPIVILVDLLINEELAKKKASEQNLKIIDINKKKGYFEKIKITPRRPITKLKIIKKHRLDAQ